MLTSSLLPYCCCLTQCFDCIDRDGKADNGLTLQSGLQMIATFRVSYAVLTVEYERSAVMWCYNFCDYHLNEWNQEVCIRNDAAYEHFKLSTRRRETSRLSDQITLPSYRIVFVSRSLWSILFIVMRGGEFLIPFTSQVGLAAKSVSKMAHICTSVQMRIC